jgi:hypothetical protein
MFLKYNLIHIDYRYKYILIHYIEINIVLQKQDNLFLF